MIENNEREKSLDHVNPAAAQISKLKEMEKETGKDFSAAIKDLQKQLNDLLKGKGLKKN
jgi:hypothetical protein